MEEGAGFVEPQSYPSQPFIFVGPEQSQGIAAAQKLWERFLPELRGAPQVQQAHLDLEIRILTAWAAAGRVTVKIRMLIS